MKLLLHMCCGPCACDIVRKIPASGLQVIPYWFNPNIQPLTEYRRRLAAVRELCDHEGLELVIDDLYDLDSFLEMAVDRHRNKLPRCEGCYRLRLDQTARRALDLGADAFSTSLLTSPHQDHDSVAAAGEQAAARYSIPFWYRDFRPDYRAAVNRSRELGLYRQQYCGCIYSERDRYHQRP